MQCKPKAARDVAPVVIGYNYEAHNEPAYKFNNLRGPISHQSTKFRRNLTISGGIILTIRFSPGALKMREWKMQERYSMESRQNRKP